jgi:hypothetical protein
MTVFESAENGGSDVPSHSLYDFVDFCGKMIDFLCFFLHDASPEFF